MILLKSFFRKKTTLNYILTYLFVFLILVVFIISRKYYIEKNNENYEGSNIFVVDSIDKKEELTHCSLFKNVKIGITLNDENNSIILAENEKIKENNVIYVPKMYKDLLNEVIHINDTDLKVVSVYESSNPSIFQVSRHTIENLLQNNNEVTYIIDLKNWAYKSNILKSLVSKYTEVYSFIEQKDDANYTTIVYAFDIFIILSVIILIIILVVSCLNIVEDEKKKNILYHYLGYSKKKTLGLTVFKISCVLLSGLIPNLCLYFILSNLFF